MIKHHVRGASSRRLIDGAVGVEKYEVLIIGGGQAGIPLARDLAGMGKRVALVERKDLGGSYYSCRKLAGHAEPPGASRHDRRRRYLEMAQFFRRMGSRVTVIEGGDQVAGHEDADVGNALKTVLEAEGIEFRVKTNVARIEAHGRDLQLTLNGPGTDALGASHIFAGQGSPLRSHERAP